MTLIRNNTSTNKAQCIFIGVCPHSLFEMVIEKLAQTTCTAINISQLHEEKRSEGGTCIATALTTGEEVSEECMDR